MVDLLYEKESFAIIGAAMAVHTALGCGFLEPVYQEAMEIEQTLRKIPFVAQKDLPIFYKGQLLKKSYRVDFLVYDKIVVEIKALSELTTREESQLMNYLKVGSYQLGLLINFGVESLEWKRIVWTGQFKHSPANHFRPEKPSSAKSGQSADKL